MVSIFGQAGVQTRIKVKGSYGRGVDGNFVGLGAPGWLGAPGRHG